MESWVVNYCIVVQNKIVQQRYRIYVQDIPWQLIWLDSACKNYMTSIVVDNVLLCNHPGWYCSHIVVIQFYTLQHTTRFGEGTYIKFYCCNWRTHYIDHLLLKSSCLVWAHSVWKITNIDDWKTLMTLISSTNVSVYTNNIHSSSKLVVNRHVLYFIIQTYYSVYIE